MIPISIITPDIIARFHSKYIRLGPDDCWEWQAGKHHFGYGHFVICYIYDKKIQIGAHVFAYMLAHNIQITEGMWVLHSCNNASCVNPNHLYEGTAAENTQQMVRDGRHSNGNDGLKTHCNNGHEFTESNTYRPPKGGRECRICKRIRARREYEDRIR